MGQNDSLTASTEKFWEVLEPSFKKVLTSLVEWLIVTFLSPTNQNLKHNSDTLPSVKKGYT
jgi:hypothetical protein